MAILRLVVDIDGDVYPELYARLAAVAGEAGRSERVRQLATSGLIWETLRIENQATTVVRPAAAPQPPARPPAPKRKPPAASAAPAASRPERRSSPEPGFIDLGLDAQPAPPPLDTPAPKDLEQALEAFGGELPVLTDVLEPVLGVAAGRETPEGAQELPAADVDHHTQPLWPRGTQRPPAARSRLQRMKERGLFKNG